MKEREKKRTVGRRGGSSFREGSNYTRKASLEGFGGKGGEGKVRHATRWGSHVSLKKKKKGRRELKEKKKKGPNS